MNIEGKIISLEHKVHNLKKKVCKCCSNGKVVFITKQELLDLISSDSVGINTTYIITDISGFSEVVVTGTSSNSVTSNASGLRYSPDYVEYEQLDANNLQTVAAGGKIIWFDHYWENTSGSPVVPTINGGTEELDPPMVIINKAANVGYDLLPVDVIISNDLTIVSIFNPVNGNSAKFGTEYNQENLFSLFALSNNSIKSSNLDALVFNNNAENIQVVTTLPLQNTFKYNTGKHINVYFTGGLNEYTNNITSNSGSFDNVELVNRCIFSNNVASGGTDVDKDCIQGFIELFDFCTYSNNETSGDGSHIFDIRTGENSSVINNTMSGISSGMNDIDQMYGDYVDGVSISGDNSFISQIYQNGYSKVGTINISGTNSGIVNIWQECGWLTGCNITTDDTIWQRIKLVNAWVKNATDINIQDLNIQGTGNTWDSQVQPDPILVIDLNGFDKDIIGETIEGGKGWFTIKHDFSTSPLASGSSFEYNLIPTGARITNIQAIGTISGGGGAVLTMGLETDDNSLITDTVGNYASGKSYSGFSNQAVTNRSLRLSASVNNITSGTITIKVEFIL